MLPHWEIKDASNATLLPRSLRIQEVSPWYSKQHPLARRLQFHLPNWKLEHNNTLVETIMKKTIVAVMFSVMTLLSGAAFASQAGDKVATAIAAKTNCQTSGCWGLERGRVTLNGKVLDMRLKENKEKFEKDSKLF